MKTKLLVILTAALLVMSAYVMSNNTEALEKLEEESILDEREEQSFEIPEVQGKYRDVDEYVSAMNNLNAD